VALALWTREAHEIDFMDNRPAESVSNDLDALFRFGVVGGVSDEQLLERFAAQTESGSEIAFDAIVRRHGPMVMGVCRRLLGNHNDAEDAFQATFIVLAMRARAVRKRQSLGPWLHGVAARICKRARLVSHRRQEEPIPGGGLIDHRGRDPDLADFNRVIDEELRQLPDKYRLPIVLCYLEGRSQEEAARELGWTKGTVSGRLARAKEVLQRRLIRRGLAPSAALVAASLNSESASAAVCAPLLATTVRTATLASFSGLNTGSTTAEVGTLVRLAVRALLLGRIARISALVFLFGIGASAIATQILGPARPDQQINANRQALAAGTRKTEPRTPRLDRFGDPLAPEIMTRLGTTQRRHTARVVGVASGHDGAAVTAQADGLVRFWDAQSGRQRSSFDVTAGTPEGHKSVRQFAMSRDGRLMAAAGFVQEATDGRAGDRVWIVSQPEAGALRTIDTKTLDLQCLDFSPDAKTIATGDGAGEVKLWDIATGQCLKATKLAANQSVFGLSFSADGNTLATNQQGKGVTLWDLQSGDIKLLAMPSITGPAPCFSADGRYMAASTNGGEAVIWDRRSSQQHHVVRGFFLGFAPDGRSLAVTRPDEEAIALINTETGDDRWKAVLGPALGRSGLAFARDAQTMIVSWNNVLRIFETENGRERFESNDAHQGALSAVCYTPSGKTIVTAGNDGTIRQWDADSGHELRVMNDPGIAHLLAISPDGTSVASTALRAPTDAPAFRVWDLTNGTLRREFGSNVKLTSTRALSFSPDGKFVLFYSPNLGLKVVDVANGQEQPAVQPRFGLKAEEEAELNLASSAFAPGAQYLALSTYTLTHVVDVASGEERFSCAGSAMAFGPDGRWLAVANDGKLDRGPPGDTPHVNTCAIDLVEIGTGAPKRIYALADRVSALAFSPDGRMLAVAAGWRECSIRLHSTEDGHELGAFACPATRTHPSALAFAPDSATLAAGLDDTTAVVFNVRNGR
jgi:RNA polymerase sigma factor (sigma-70 family)